MSSRRLSRIPLPLRVLVLAMIAFGIIMQPFFASIGEVHLLAHDSADLLASQHGQHSLADHATGRAQGDPAPGDEDSLHALMHYAQCCGQVGALWSLHANIPTMAPDASRPAMAEARDLALSPLRAPFRPPISV